MKQYTLKHKLYYCNTFILFNCSKCFSDFLEEQPKQDSVQNNPSNILEIDTQPAENESLPD